MMYPSSIHQECLSICLHPVPSGYICRSAPATTHPTLLFTPAQVLAQEVGLCSGPCLLSGCPIAFPGSIGVNPDTELELLFLSFRIDG